MISRTTVKILLALVLGLPLLQAVFSWVGGLLEVMGDQAAADVLAQINTAGRIAWLVSIVGLVVVLAVRSVEEPGEE
ncbi:MAG: hypothetical protein MI725_08050 [Pirellulales bacterium]|nr:hypothetical protein [Pirellulales bacterium]